MSDAATGTVGTAGSVDAIVVMGVSGCGKTSVGRHLAHRLGWPYLEGDEFHPPANIAKMAAGIPLQDEDRWGWLASIAARISEARCGGDRVVVSCSALKRRYRDRLREAAPRILFVHLQGDRETIMGRMVLRTGHYMPATLLDSQLADLEPPEADELALVFGIDPSPDAIAARVASFVSDE